MSGYVTAQEANLLTLARSALGIAVSGDLNRLLVTHITPPTKLGPTARGVLQETLARGSVLALARGGGWAEGHHGRLWERETTPPALEFTPNLIRLLQWVLKTPMAEHDQAPLVLERGLTPGEELFAVMLLQRIKGLPGELALAKQSALRASPLVLLAHAGTLAMAHSLPTTLPPLRLEVHGVLIAGLRDLMSRSWALDEASKKEIDRPEVMTRLGEAQTAVLNGFLDTVSGALRHRALAGFLVDAAGQWLSMPRTSGDYSASLNPNAPLRERMEARKQGASLMRALVRLRGWDGEHRSMHFLDDDFAVGQALIRDWNGFGDAGFREAERLISELDALPS